MYFPGEKIQAPLRFFLTASRKNADRRTRGGEIFSPNFPEFFGGAWPGGPGGGPRGPENGPNSGWELGYFWAYFGPKMAHFGAFWAPFWAYFGTILGPFWGLQRPQI